MFTGFIVMIVLTFSTLAIAAAVMKGAVVPGEVRVIEDAEQMRALRGSGSREQPAATKDPFATLSGSRPMEAPQSSS